MNTGRFEAIPPAENTPEPQEDNFQIFVYMFLLALFVDLCSAVVCSASSEHQQAMGSPWQSRKLSIHNPDKMIVPLKMLQFHRKSMSSNLKHND